MRLAGSLRTAWALVAELRDIDGVSPIVLPRPPA
jgi:hypothetical protein